MARTGWRGVGIDLEGPNDLVGEVLSHLPSFYDDAQPARATIRVFPEDGGFALEVDGLRPSAFIQTYPSTLDLANLVELSVVERLSDLVAVHAGAVAFEGRVVLLPGSTQTGKTHLVTALLAAGASYLSDEFALLDEAGRVHPYPRLLALREGGGIRRATVDEFGGQVSDASLPAAGVAVLTYDSSVTGLDATELSASQTWLHLMEHCICARTSPEPSFSVTTRVAAAVTSLWGTRGEAKDVAAMLRIRLAL